MRFRCPNCDQNIQIGDLPAFPADRTEVLTCPSCQSRISLSADSTTTQIPVVGLTLGHLELQQVVGEGAFGTVYKAWDRNLQRSVAVKLPRQDRVRSDAGKSFLREARAAAKIQHPNIVQVHEVGQSEIGFYIVSEFIDGITLSEWIKIRELPPSDAVRLMVTICRAVHAAHEANVVHRDLKPGNVLMDIKNVPHVSDFGLARNGGADITVTHDGRIVGTPSYMSPEQARGESEQTTSLSDVWSLGVMLYELVVQQRPFVATDSHSVLYRILSEDPQRPRAIRSELSEDLQTIILKALEKNPKDRYSTASAMADDLQRFVENKPIEARPIGRLRRFSKWSQRNPRLAAVSAICVLLTLLIAGLVIWPRGNSVSPALLTIRMECSLDGQPVPDGQKVQWAAVPIDETTRLPDANRSVRMDGAVLECQLQPGDYLICVEAAGFGFHEVYRTVPDSPKPVTRLFDHQSVVLLPESVVGLPQVRILPENTVTQGMSLIQGGSFQMGDERQDRLAHLRTVEGFWIDAAEVTVGAYKRFRSTNEAFLQGPDDYPVVELTFHEALAYAESVGKRLLGESEYEFAATNRGSTNFPWGNEPRPVDEIWEYGAAGNPTWDRLPDEDVFGLHSNAAEWTDSWLAPYPKMPAWPDDLIKSANLHGARVVRGGPVTLGPNDRSKNLWNQTPRARAAWGALTEDSEIGFRCGRSQRPRFVNR